MTIISSKAGLDEHIEVAIRQANATNTPYEVWEHVGLYGHRGRHDIQARHEFRVLPSSATTSDLPDDWALVAIVSPKEAM